MKINRWRIVCLKGAEGSIENLYDGFKQLFLKSGLTQGKKTLFFDAKKHKKSDSLFTHYGFSFSIEKNLNNETYLLVSPKQVITPDGKTYDVEFVKQSHHRLSKKTDPFKYGQRCQKLREFDVAFANGQTHVFEKGFEFQLELDESKLDIRYIQEPEVDFGSGKYHSWPAAGLKRYFPLAYNLGLSSHPQKIRVLLIGKKDCFSLLKKLVHGGGRGNYPFPGFSKIYQCELEMGQDRFVELLDSEISTVTSSNEIVDLLLQKAVAKKNNAIDFDVCLIELVDEWSKFFINQPIDLHDSIKVAFYQRNICTQIFNKNSLSAVDGSENLFEHLSLGIYYKAGGNPWKLKNSWTNTSYIGVSFGISRDKTQKLIGIAEIFDSYGQYLSQRSISIKEINLSEKVRSKDLHLTAKQFTMLTTALLNDYKQTNDNNYPSNLVVHKTSDFNDNEQNLLKSFKDYPIDFSLVYIQTDHPYHIITEDNIEPTRGLYWRKSDNESFLYSSGSSAGKYYLPNAPIPLYVNLIYSSNFSIDQITDQIIGLTKLNFNSTNTYSKEPVTLIHSRKIVDLLRAGLSTQNIPEDPRFYL